MSALFDQEVPPEDLPPATDRARTDRARIERARIERARIERARIERARARTERADGETVIDLRESQLSEGASQEPELVLEPASLPVFARSLRGYSPRHVDAYIGEQRRRMAILRHRAMQAEAALARKGAQAQVQSPATARTAPAACPPPRSDCPPPRSDCPPPPSPARLASTNQHPPLAPAARPPASRQVSLPSMSELDSSAPVASALGHYGACSAIWVLTSEVFLLVAYAVLRISSPATCDLVASAAVGIPAAVLCRVLLWRRVPSRRSPHRRATYSLGKRRELSFWVLTALGAAFSVSSVAVVQGLPQFFALGVLAREIVVECISFSALGMMWLAQAILLERSCAQEARGNLAATSTGHLGTNKVAAGMTGSST